MKLTRQLEVSKGNVVPFEALFLWENGCFQSGTWHGGMGVMLYEMRLLE